MWLLSSHSRVWDRCGSVGTCYVNMKAKVTMTLPEAKENPGFLADYQQKGPERKGLRVF